MPETEQFLASTGTDVFISTPPHDFLAREIKTWGDNIRAARIELN